MKKIYYIVAASVFCFFVTQSAYGAGAVSQPANDTTVSVSSPATPDFDDFHASTNVRMSGGSIDTEFALGAYHSQVANKKSGKMFGMASDSSAMYYFDISATASPTAVTATNSSAFSVATWTAM